MTGLIQPVLLDGLLATTILGLGWAALASRSVRQAVMLFIAFGLLMALVWVRLRAPDVALAEAAIGAGLSGVLLLAALGDNPDAAGDTTGGPRPGHFATAVVVRDLLILGLAILLGRAYVFALAPGTADGGAGPGLAGQVSANLAASGVTNPVTAVLLNFRAYDTLLELAVLLAAVLAIIGFGPARHPYPAAGPVFAGLTRWLVPLLILVGGYLLWVGAHAPGGAFQAGAMLAGAGVMLRLAGHGAGGLPAGAPVRAIAVSGVGLFLAVGLALMLTGRPFLSYPPGWASALILLIETAATMAIAAALVLAFMGGRPEGWCHDDQRAGPPGERS